MECNFGSGLSAERLVFLLFLLHHSKFLVSTSITLWNQTNVTTMSCSSCTIAKTKWTPSSHSSSCERCERLHKLCSFSDQDPPMNSKKAVLMSVDFNTALSSSCLTCKKEHQKCFFLFAEHTCQRCKRLSRKCPSFAEDLMICPQVVVSNDSPLVPAQHLSVDDTLEVCYEPRLELLGGSLANQTRCTEGTGGVSGRTDSRTISVSISIGGPSNSTSCPQCPVMPTVKKDTCNFPIKDWQVTQPNNQNLSLNQHHPFDVSYVAKSKLSSSGRQKAAFIKSRLSFVHFFPESCRNKSKGARKKAKK